MSDIREWLAIINDRDDTITCLYREVTDYKGKTVELTEVIKKLERYPFEPICLLCGKLEPCMTDEEGRKHGGPGKPCMFDPTPKQLFEENKRLRKEIEELKSDNYW